jgi:hypothetical protein
MGIDKAIAKATVVKMVSFSSRFQAWKITNKFVKLHKIAYQHAH